MKRRPFRFGTHLNQVGSKRDLVERSRRAEDAGFSTITVPDHFRPAELAPLVAMMAIADATTTVRIGSNVLGNDYRHPLVLGRELASLDLLSEGRLEVGIGAGWLQSDYAAWGIPSDPPGVRVRRLAESVEVLTRLFLGEPFRFEGEFYQIDAPARVALSLQRPRPPLMIGAGGRKMLELAARTADILGITFNQRLGVYDAKAMMADAGNAAEGIHDQKIEWIRDAAGDRLDEIELGVFAIVQVTDARLAALEATARAQGVSTAWLADAPQFYFGTLAEIADDLHAKRERYGISYFITMEQDLDTLSPLVSELSGC